MFGPYPAFRLNRARRAARVGDWFQAAQHYQAYLSRRPSDSGAWVQLGHAHKEAGAFGPARDAYRQATVVAPESGEAWLQYGHASRLAGDRQGAVAAFVRASCIESNADQAAIELIALGKRELLPVQTAQRIENGEGLCGGESGKETEKVYAVGRYRSYHQRLDQPEAPGGQGASRFLVVIDGRTACAADVHRSTRSLRAYDASIEAVFLVTDETLDPGSMEGIRVFPGDRAMLPIGLDLLIVAAGTELLPGALGWFNYALHRSGVVAAYADYEEWDGETRSIDHAHPAFQPMFDPLWFSVMTPPCLAMRAPTPGLGATWQQILQDGRDLATIATRAPVVHIPLLLSSRRTQAAPAPAPAPPAVAVAAGEASKRIQVIIQTRDAPEMLRAAVETLRKSATACERLDITIIDNRSAAPETAALLDGWGRVGIARTIQHDEPFNWARANNVAAAQGTAPILLFLNNDVEMLNPGWDDALCRYLSDEQIGVVGALLLYGDRTVQHAGVILGLNGGYPIHEGVGNLPYPGGAGGRWHRNRYASAVTGAWMGVRRDDFVRTSGFDESLAVSYNDIDYCLRSRALGLHVVHAADIIAYHGESVTRGLHLDEAGRARENAEWATLQARWGQALCHDPAYNPHWTRNGQPFDGLRYPTLAETLDWIDRSAQPNPWQV